MTAVEIEEWVLWVNDQKPECYVRTGSMWVKLSSEDVLRIIKWSQR